MEPKKKPVARKYIRLGETYFPIPKRQKKDVLLRSGLEDDSLLPDAAVGPPRRRFPVGVKSRKLRPKATGQMRKSHLAIEAKKLELVKEKNPEAPEVAPVISSRIQQLEKHVLALPSSNPALPTVESIDIVNAIASETLPRVWERRFDHSTLVVAAISYEEYIASMMLPLIFDDMGIPEDQREAISNRVEEERADLRETYFLAHEAELSVQRKST